jgi:hypothetical protein
MPKPTFFTNTPEKDIIREVIVKQFNKWLAIKETAIFNTLESDQWIVAREVAKIAENQGKRITLHNFEFHWARVKKFCPWLKSAPASVNYVQHSFGDDRFFRYIQEDGVPSFSWADYCGTPLKKEIRAFRKAIRAGDVLYVTFSLNPRFKPSIDKTLLPIMERRKGESWSEVGLAVTARLEKIIRTKLGGNFKRVIFSHYVTNAGKRGQTPMITVGWHFEKDSAL